MPVRKPVLGVLVLVAGAIGFKSMPAEDSRKADRLVLAFYYPWYRTVERSGFCTWNFGPSHYEARDAECEANRHTPQLPVGGLYDSRDPEVIQRQLAESRAAGIDGWIVSWWGIGHPNDALDLVLSAAETSAPDFKITIYYEQIPGCRGNFCPEVSRRERIAAVKKDFLFLRDHYFSRPAWLRAQGRPVVFIFSRAMTQGAGLWPEIIRELRRDMDLYLSGDATFTRAGSFVPKSFDQVHFYNPLYELKLAGPENLSYRGMVQRSHRAGRSAAVTVVPGYDERKIPGRPGLHLERQEGKTYQQVWEQALAARPDWILITSWNEWYEGSEIEPSRELGQLYLQLTAAYSARFKQP